jgi:hypothetical protein
MLLIQGCFPFGEVTESSYEYHASLPIKRDETYSSPDYALPLFFWDPGNKTMFNTAGLFFLWQINILAAKMFQSFPAD